MYHLSTSFIKLEPWLCIKNVIKGNTKFHRYTDLGEMHHNMDMHSHTLYLFLSLNFFFFFIRNWINDKRLVINIPIIGYLEKVQMYKYAWKVITQNPYLTKTKKEVLSADPKINWKVNLAIQGGSKLGFAGGKLEKNKRLQA